MMNQVKTYLDKNFPNHKGFSLFGSLIYGTFKQGSSDVDVIVIEDSLHGQSKTQGGYDLQFISEESFKKQLHNCDIKALEVFFCDKKQIKFPLTSSMINWETLRASISEKSSHSFVKAKKKFLDNELYVGQKSLFHSLRILTFGIQLATHKNITDFGAANEIYSTIMNHPKNEADLLSLQQNLKQEYNRLHSEFKKVAPKS